MFDLGSAYPAVFSVTGDEGQPVSAGTVTLTITLPDGSTETPDVPNPPPAPGQYRVSYVTTMPGRHMVRWVATSPAQAFTDVFDVAPADIPSIVSLADAKEFLGIRPDDTSEDDELRRWLAGTTEVIERVLDETIARRPFAQTEFNEHPRSLRLFKVPVISLDTLVSADGQRTWVPGQDVRADLDTGLVHLIRGRGPHLYGEITATGYAGYQVVPYHVQQGALVLLQHVWETQRGVGTVGGGVIGPEEAGDMRQMYMLPRKVREWLGEPRPAVL